MPATVKKRQYIGNTVTLFMALSLVLTVALVLVVKPIVNAVSTPAEAVDGAALGTTLSQGLSVAVSLFVILKRRLGIALKRTALKPMAPLREKYLKSAYR